MPCRTCFSPKSKLDLARSAIGLDCFLVIVFGETKFIGQDDVGKDLQGRAEPTGGRGRLGSLADLLSLEPFASFALDGIPFLRGHLHGRTLKP
jgi:hypothetical protein